MCGTYTKNAKVKNKKQILKIWKKYNISTYRGEFERRKTMNKIVKIVIAIIVAIVIIMGVYALRNSKPKSNLNINSDEDLTALIDQIYSGITIEMPRLQTQTIDVTDTNMVKTFTGLDSNENIENIVASEPLMTSQAYSLVLVKVKDGANITDMAKAMNENIDVRKWICVSAEKVYTATSGNVICLVMTNADTAKTVFDSFKTIAGAVDKEYERTVEEPVFPTEETEIPSEETAEPTV